MIDRNELASKIFVELCSQNHKELWDGKHNYQARAAVFARISLQVAETFLYILEQFPSQDCVNTEAELKTEVQDDGHKA